MLAALIFAPVNVGMSDGMYNKEPQLACIRAAIIMFAILTSLCVSNPYLSQSLTILQTFQGYSIDEGAQTTL